MNFPHTATLRRTTKSGTKYTYGDAGTIVCFLQPLDSQSAQDYGITFTKSSKAYLPIDSDIHVGDRLVIDATEYGVKGLRTHNYGTLRHMYAVLEEIT